MRPVSKGQAHPYRRRQTHLEIRVREMTDEMMAVARKYMICVRDMACSALHMKFPVLGGTALLPYGALAAIALTLCVIGRLSDGGRLLAARPDQVFVPSPDRVRSIRCVVGRAKVSRKAQEKEVGEGEEEDEEEDEEEEDDDLDEILMDTDEDDDDFEARAVR
ncbi:unnamed protein product [Symbiodinium natans]|uniref:Uncharacterized protein n=1 Tax=Symbiodinium natans TaxID=878477 RepID=A0A812KE30_9DINO|nr:unnamed protein product [Symbiodinium natans]